MSFRRNNTQILSYCHNDIGLGGSLPSLKERKGIPAANRIECPYVNVYRAIVLSSYSDRIFKHFAYRY